MTGRDARGRFINGHGVKSPGRPPLAADLPFVEGVKQTVNAEKVAQVMEKLHQAALDGNIKAAAIWLAYAVGKPEDLEMAQQIETLQERIALLEERLKTYGPNGYSRPYAAARPN